MAQKHFDPPVEFLDLFLPINLSSQSRARVFLWIMYHYLSGPDGLNPFDDEYSRANPGRVPRMRPLSREEQAQENIDPADELEWGKRMSALRSKFLRELVDEMEMEKRRKKNPLPPPPPAPSTSYSGEFWRAGHGINFIRWSERVANYDVQHRRWPCSGRPGTRRPRAQAAGVRRTHTRVGRSLRRPMRRPLGRSRSLSHSEVCRTSCRTRYMGSNTGCLCRRYHWGGSYPGAHHAEP